MTLQLSLAEKFLAPTFISDGWTAFTKPADQTTFSEPTLKRIASMARLPEDPEVVVKVIGAVQMAAGAMLFMGKFRRLSSAALALSLVPSTVGKPTGGTFGLADTPANPGTGAKRRTVEQRTAQRKNLALLGGLALVFTDLGGAPSLSWRAARGLRKARSRTADVAARTADMAEGLGQRITSAASDSPAPSAILDTIKPRIEELSHLAAAAIHRVSGDASVLGNQIGSHVGDLRGQVGDLRGHVGDVRGQVVDLGEQVGGHLGDLGNQVADFARASLKQHGK